MRRVFEHKPGARSAPVRGVLLSFVALLGSALLMWGISASAQDERSSYEATELVSNVPGRAETTDSSLVNPWGLAIVPGGPWGVANEGNGRVTLYGGDGTAFPGLSPRVLTVPVNPGGVFDNARPTGIVFNSTNDFNLTPGGPARLLAATLDGIIVGWSSLADEYGAALLVDNSPEAAYTGATIALDGGNVLYVANFNQGRVETYGTDFSAVRLNDQAFTDPGIPDGFSPYNIQNINGILFVTFAEPLQGGVIAAAGEGSGYVDAFDPEGNLVLRFQHGPWFDAPWGVALSPSRFGDFGLRLLVGNAGSGSIASFDPLTGEFLGYLPGADGYPLVVPGLHGLGFGNDGTAGPATTLYFTAGFGNAGRSAFGSITESTRP